GTFDAGLTSRKYNIPLFVLYPLLLTPPPQGNIDLIKLGGISLSNGNQLVQHLNSLVGHAEVIKNQSSAKENRNDVSLVQNVEEPETEYQVKTALKDDMRDKILNVLNGRPISLTEIIKLVHLDWTTKKLAAYLKKMTEVEIIKKGQKNYYKNRALQIRQGRLANDDPKSVQIEIF
ncbi:MAG TPA: hypothetical protein VKR41_09075, partial [Puia sp.]|nr:hypothetical protein [Puia sp.]